MNKLANNYPTLGGWKGWWRVFRRSGSGGSGGVGGGDAEEEGVEEAGELVVEERGAIMAVKTLCI